MKVKFQHKSKTYILEAQNLTDGEFRKIRKTKPKKNTCYVIDEIGYICEDGVKWMAFNIESGENICRI